MILLEKKWYISINDQFVQFLQHFTVFYSILNKSVIHQLCHSMLILTRKTPSTIISLLYWFHWANNSKLHYNTNLCIFCSILQYFTVLWKEILVQNNTFWKYTYQRCNFCKKTFCCKYLWWYPYMGSWLFPYLFLLPFPSLLCLRFTTSNIFFIFMWESKPVAQIRVFWKKKESCKVSGAFVVSWHMRGR